MSNFNLEAEYAHLASLRAAVEAFGIECFPVQDSGMAMAFAVPMDTNEGTAISMVSFLVGQPGMVYLTGGVSIQPVAERLTILETLNRAAANNPTFSPFLHEAIRDVLVQIKLPAETLLNFPPLLDLLVGAVPDVIQGTRRELSDAGVTGDFYGWSNQNLTRLAVHSVM